MTLARLAEQAGLSTSYLNDIEHDRTVPSLGKLLQLAGALDTTVVGLLAGVDPYG